MYIYTKKVVFISTRTFYNDNLIGLMYSKAEAIIEWLIDEPTYISIQVVFWSYTVALVT